MQIGDVVQSVERPVVDVRLVVGARRDRFVGEEIAVDMWPQLANPLAAFDPVLGAIVMEHRCLGGLCVTGPQQRVHQRHPVAGPQRKVVADDRGLNLAVQGNRGDGVFHAGHDEDFELHVVGWIAQLPQARRQAIGRRVRRVVREQYGVELLPFGLGHQLLVGQRRGRVEKPRAVTIFAQ